MGTVPFTHINFHMTYLQAGPFRLTSKEINQKTLSSFRHRSLFSSPPPPSKKLEVVQKKKKKSSNFCLLLPLLALGSRDFYFFFYLCTPQTLSADMRMRTDSSCFVGNVGNFVGNAGNFVGNAGPAQGALEMKALRKMQSGSLRSSRGCRFLLSVFPPPSSYFVLHFDKYPLTVAW